MGDYIQVQAFGRLLNLGAKYCPDHLPKRQDSDEVWEVCLSGFHKGPTNEAVEVTIGHDLIKVRLGPQDLQYFENIREMYRTQLNGRDSVAFAVPTERVFLLLDVCSFSLFPMEIQPIVRSELFNVVDRIVGETEPATLERKLDTGDGFILAFLTSHKPEPWPLNLAQGLARALVERNRSRGAIHFRISLARGVVYLTKDLDGQINYIGPAIIEAKRLVEGRHEEPKDRIYFDKGIQTAHERYLGGFVFHEANVKDKFKQEHTAFSLEY